MPPPGTRDTAWFTDARLGLFIHWGLYSLPARHEWVRRNERMSASQYRRYFERFDPDLYNPREWAAHAKAAGMKYVVITAKHHDGFCLWDSAHTDYKATKTPAGRDLLAPLLEAFRAAGLRVGLYYSLLDWHHPEFPVDMFHPQAEDQAFRAANTHRDIRRYAAYVRAQTEELLTGFGKIDLLWYDFSYTDPQRPAESKGRNEWESEELLALIRRLQPQALINNRLDHPEGGDFATPEQHQPAVAPVDQEGKLVVWEACQTFSGSWGYHRDEQTWKSLPQLLGMLVDSVSKGGNLLLNVGPTARGEFDPRAVDRLRGLGTWMHHHSRAIHGCGPAPAAFQPAPDTRLTFNPNSRRLYLHLLAWPFRHVHLRGLAGKVRYAQFLHDCSEVKIHEPKTKLRQDDWTGVPTVAEAVMLELPVAKPWPEIPVIELHLDPALAE